MKNVLVLMSLLVILCAVVFCAGCSQPGETAAEGRRRHIRNMRINQEGLNRDIDKVMLFDKPSTLSDKRAP